MKTSSDKRKTAAPQLRMTPGTYYVWVAGSCDYGHEERCSGGTYIMIKNGEVVETYVAHEDHTTEFRMILTVMIHAMEVIPNGSDIVFLTNVSYILQNWDKEPTGKSANADLIGNCISVRERHASVSVKIVPFHKYRQLQEANSLAHEAMIELRNKGKEPDKSVESAKYAAYNKYDRIKSNDKNNR